MAIDIEGAQEFMKNLQSKKREWGCYDNEDGIPFFKMKANSENTVRIIAVATDWTVGSHWGVLKGRNGGQGGTVKCPMVFDNSPCPVCETAQLWHNSSNPAERVKAEKMRIQIKHPILLVNLNVEGAPSVKVYEATYTIFSAIIDYSQRYGDVTDLKRGRNMTIKRRDNGNKVEYSVLFDPDRSSFELPEHSKLKTEEDLRKILKPYSYSEIEQALMTGSYPKKEKDDNDLDEEDDRPNQGKARPMNKASKQPTGYSRGLPAPKTRDEEEPYYEDEPAQLPPRKLKESLQNTGKEFVSSVRNKEVEEDLFPEVWEEPVAPVYKNKTRVQPKQLEPEVEEYEDAQEEQEVEQPAPRVLPAPRSSVPQSAPANNDRVKQKILEAQNRGKK